MWLTFRSGPEDGRVVEITGDRFVLGREDGCSLKVPDDRVSRRHAELVPLPDGTVRLQDLGSTNGTYLDGLLLDAPAVLRGGERIQVGDTLLTVATSQSGAAATAVGMTPIVPPAVDPTPSTVERASLRRWARNATVAGAAAAVAAAAVVVLFVTGVIGGGDGSGNATTAASLDIPAIIDAARPSTGLVTVSLDGTEKGTGTGWVLDAARGLVVTNFHVVNAGTSYVVRIGDVDRPAEIVAAAPCEDLALLKVTNTEGLRTMPLGSQQALRQGETVVAVGFPASASETPNLSATSGLVSVVQESFDLRAIDVPQYRDVIQTSADINPGNSGGPLLNTRAELVGVNSAGISLLGGRTIQGQGYAIGVDRAREILPTLEAGTSIGWTGAIVEHRDGAPGLVVVGAVPGTPAARAFTGGEVLIEKVNGTQLDNSLPSYCDAIGTLRSGDSATFTVQASDGTVSREKVAMAGTASP